MPDIWLLTYLNAIWKNEPVSGKDILVIWYYMTKGQLISKYLFVIFNSSEKWTKKFDFTTPVPQVKLCLFFFGENWRHQKDISKLTDLYHTTALWPAWSLEDVHNDISWCMHSANIFPPSPNLTVSRFKFWIRKKNLSSETRRKWAFLELQFTDFAWPRAVEK